MLQVALNGTRTRADHDRVPTTAEALAAEAAACVRRGALTVHLHPRGGDGAETLAPAVVDSVVTEIRARCGVTVGVSTGAWIEPDPERRAHLVASWRAADYASVNLSEDGAELVMRSLIDAGIGIEAGVWSPEDAERLAAANVGRRLTRVLVEIEEDVTTKAVARAAALHAALDEHGLTARRLQHGVGDSAWILIRDAATRRLDTRVGLEDVLTTPRGGVTGGNVELVDEALAIIGGAELRAG